MRLQRITDRRKSRWRHLRDQRIRRHRLAACHFRCQGQNDRIAAVEGLGSCTLIASDKTGTLTCNELTVQELRLPDGHQYAVGGEGFVPEGTVLDGTLPIEPGQSVLFLMVHTENLAKLSDQFAEFNPTVLQTALSKEEEAKLREHFGSKEPGTA